jgi:DNA-binding MarR family transcriptional regulator
MQEVVEEADRSPDRESGVEHSPSTIAMDGLRRVVRALRRADAESRGRGGISSAQLFVLRQLRGKPALSIGDLSRATLTSQSSVSEVVARLETRGLLSRSKASDDNRRAELSVTAAGRKVLEDAPQPFQERLVSALRHLASEDQQALAKGMGAWLREAGISDAPPTMFFEPDGKTRRATTGCTR